MKMTTSNLVTGMFKSNTAAENAVQMLMKVGYHRNDISLLMSDETRSRHFGVEAGTKAAEGAGIGSAVGGAVGATIAAIAAIGTSLILPGLGLVIAGPIAAALAGAGAGGAAGGLVGALVGAGVPEYRAKMYESGLKAGGVLVGVHAKSSEDADKLEQLMTGAGAEGIRTDNAAE